MITFTHVSKIYEPSVKALNNVSLHVPKGKMVVLLGPSGCGKTTLLRMVNRLISLTSGEIKIDGQDIHTIDEIELRRKIGYVIQHNGLFPNMTVEKNITIVPKLLGWNKEKRRERYDDLMNLIGLNAEELQNRFPNELSGGQQQRIGIARAMAVDPPILLMDEPFSALDPVVRSRLQDEFSDIQKRLQKTILFVSHDVTEALKLADYIAVFNQGELVQFCSPKELLQQPKNAFVEGFLGDNRTFKQLSLLTVRDLIEQGFTRKEEYRKEMHATVSPHTTLQETLRLLLEQPEDLILWKNPEDQTAGWIHHQDIKDYLALSGQERRPIHEERKVAF